MLDESPPATLDAIGCLDDEDIHLDLAAIDLAAADRADPDLATPIAMMEALSNRLDRGVTAATDRAEALSALLAGREGFRGAREDYDSPANADLISVLERRRGLPVALSILYVALARRAGWQAHVLGLPGHVLMALGSGIPGEEPVVIDPFDRGALVDTGLIPAARASARLDNRETLVRLVMNQITRAEAGGKGDRALTLLRRLTRIAPAMPQLWWERARLEQAAGNLDAARYALAAMGETTRDPVLIRRIMAARRMLSTLSGRH